MSYNMSRLQSDSAISIAFDTTDAPKIPGPDAEPAAPVPSNNDHDLTHHEATGNSSRSIPATDPAEHARSPSWPTYFLDQPQPGHESALNEPGEESADDEVEAMMAADQVARRSILIDDDMASDAGYETDSVASASTSLSSGVREYIFENGRRYHKFREGRYNFPNDDIEQQREDMKHAMVKMLCGQLFFSPIGDHPQEVLDIGTGTGIWAIESTSFPQTVTR
jgi:Arc/MetJ family transcription regulator